MLQPRRAVFTSAVTILGFVAATTLVPTPAAAQAPGQPVPPWAAAQVGPAKKVFIAPVRNRAYQLDRNDDDWRQYSDANYFQEQILETVEIWRLYQLVPVPAPADLV